MNQGVTLLGGIGLGAGLMYVLDPDLGRRRRAHLRDRATSVSHQTADAARVIARDLGQRSYGLLAESRARFTKDDSIDEVIAERVRSKIGRIVSHPRAIEVLVRDGRVTLTGAILGHEVNKLLSRVSAVRGVTGVDNQLKAFRNAGDVPALQGGLRRTGEQWDVMQANWSPSTRLMAGAAGGALLIYGFTQRFPTACVAGTAGLALLARAATNMPFKRLVGVGAGRYAVEVHKTIHIAAPIEQVFEFWTYYENFPRFMSHVREIRDLGNGRSLWVAEGPAGFSVAWNAVLTRFVPFELIAWKSEPGSTIPNAGAVQFEPLTDWETRVDIRLSYNPPGGALGHTAALLFGADPKSAMDDDLVRLKSLLEEGKTSSPGKKVTREEFVDPAFRGRGIPSL